jgi:hypothetical protein
LTIGQPTVENDRYSFPVVLLGSDEGVAALNFSFHYDPAVFVPVGAQPGQAAANANKQVTGNAPEPGQYVVVMMGVNRDSVMEGTVAQVVMRQVGEPVEGVSRVTLDETAMATFEGMALPSRGDSRAVRMGESAPPEEAETPEPDSVDEPEVPGESEDVRRPVRPQGAMTAPEHLRADASPSQDAVEAPGAPVESLNSEPGSASSVEESHAPMGRPLSPLGVREVPVAQPDSVGSESRTGALSQETGYQEMEELVVATGLEEKRPERESWLPARRFGYIMVVSPLVLVLTGYAVWRTRRRR